MLGPKGTVSYNGVTFAAPTATNVEITPQYDSAGRTVIYNVYRFTIEFTIHNTDGTAIDTTIDALRPLLTRPGGDFMYQTKGLGAFFINTGAAVKDVVWGPKPTMLSWRPLGQDRAARLVWKVEVAIPDCDGARYELGIMEFCYSLQVSEDEFGLATRTYTGHLRIPQTRVTVNTKTLSDNADQRYWEQIIPKTPRGFRRVRKDKTLSEDKCRLDFTFVDEQLPGPPLPRGVVKATFTERLRSEGPFAVNKVLTTFNGKYELDPRRNVNVDAGVKAFNKLVLKRLQHQARFAKDKFQLLVNYEVSNPNLYGVPVVDISATYRMFIPVNKWLEACGFWQTADAGDDWDIWHTSLSVNDPRGAHNLRFWNGDDVIVDLCGRRRPRRGTPLVTGQQPQLGKGKGGQLPVPERGPSENGSWGRYTARITCEYHDNNVVLRKLPHQILGPPGPPRTIKVPPVPTRDPDRAGITPLPDRDLDGRGGGGGGVTDLELEFPEPKKQVRSRNNDRDSTRDDPAVMASEDAVAQFRALPEAYIVLTGEALRVGYPIDPPQVVSVGGKPVVQVREKYRDGVQTWVAGSFFGVTVFAARWSLRYQMVDQPDVLPIPDSPLR